MDPRKKKFATFLAAKTILKPLIFFIFDVDPRLKSFKTFQRLKHM